MAGLRRGHNFGVARAESRISTTNGRFLKGKLAFMAPERIMHGQVDRRCDIYAAGVTLWEALSGRRLFEADGTPVSLELGSARTFGNGVQHLTYRPAET